MSIYRTLLLILFVALPISAEPEVIADFGGKKTGLISPREKLKQIKKKQAVPPLIARDINTIRFPVESRMTLGVIHSHANDKPVQQPFFIIGVDEHSIEWLKTNLRYLREINARGLLTNVQSPREVERLRHQASGISLEAIPVDALADVYELDHYPVLVMQEEITQ